MKDFGVCVVLVPTEKSTGVALAPSGRPLLRAACGARRVLVCMLYSFIRLWQAAIRSQSWAACSNPLSKTSSPVPHKWSG